MLTVTATNLPRVMNCNGSRLMPPAFPNIDTDRALRDEGDAAHYMALAIFNGQFKLEELIERKAENGVYMTPEMGEHVETYLREISPGEMEVDTSYGTDSYRVNGRADHISYVIDQQLNTSVLTIDDFKYGWSIVEPYFNWTLIWYAIGYIFTRRVSPATITFRIHQPRPYHPLGKLREWSISYNDLMNISNGLYARIIDTLTNPTDELRTNPYCRGCYALATCPAARKASYNAIDAADIAMSDDVSDGLLSFELDTLNTAKATLERRLDALSELAKHRLTGGAILDNYSLQHQYANTRWKSGMSAETLSIASGIDLTKPGLVTPAEAKRRGMSETTCTALTERPMTGTKLVRVSAADRAKRILEGK